MGEIVRVRPQVLQGLAANLPTLNDLPSAKPDIRFGDYYFCTDTFQCYQARPDTSGKLQWREQAANDIVRSVTSDVSALVGLFVVGSVGTLAAAGAGASALGVLIDAPAGAGYATIRTHGIANVIPGGAITIYDDVASDAAGKAKTAVKGKVDTSDAGAASDPVIGSNVMGVALLAAAGAANPATIPVLVSRAGIIPTTNA